MGRRVDFGEDFEADVKIKDASSRSLVLKVVLVLGTVFLIGAALYGVFDQNFSYLAGVWSAVAPIYGGVAGYYFGSHKPSNK